jgi:ribosomal protein L11 methylase PrmA
MGVGSDLSYHLSALPNTGVIGFDSDAQAFEKCNRETQANHTFLPYLTGDGIECP